MRRTQRLRRAIETVTARRSLHPRVQRLLRTIDTYRRQYDMSRTAWGVWAVRDGHYIRRLELGRMPRVETFDFLGEIMREPPLVWDAKKEQT